MNLCSKGLIGICYIRKVPVILTPTLETGPVVSSEGVTCVDPKANMATMQPQARLYTVRTRSRAATPPWPRKWHKRSWRTGRSRREFPLFLRTQSIGPGASGAPALLATATMPASSGTGAVCSNGGADKLVHRARDGGCADCMQAGHLRRTVLGPLAQSTRMCRWAGALMDVMRRKYERSWRSGRNHGDPDRNCRHSGRSVDGARTASWCTDAKILALARVGALNTVAIVRCGHCARARTAPRQAVWCS